MPAVSFAQVSFQAWVCFNEVHVLREQREYDVVAAAHQERAAWTALERASRPGAEDEAAIPACRASWQTAARALVQALQALKR